MRILIYSPTNIMNELHSWKMMEYLIYNLCKRLTFAVTIVYANAPHFILNHLDIFYCYYYYSSAWNHNKVI